MKFAHKRNQNGQYVYVLMGNGTVRMIIHRQYPHYRWTVVHDTLFYKINWYNGSNSNDYTLLKFKTLRDIQQYIIAKLL